MSSVSVAKHFERNFLCEETEALGDDDFGRSS